jgi:hypothetical protein
MPDENHAQLDEIDEEMPDDAVAPCGDIFETPGATYVTDADGDSAGDAGGD